MTTENILRELDKLPLTEKLLVIERTLKSIRTEKQGSLKAAVDSLYDDYKNNKELAVFTQLDNEPFYETRWDWLVSLEPTIGSELQKTRPAIIVNDNTLGKLPLKIIVPLTDWKTNME